MLASGEYHSTNASGSFGQWGGAGQGPTDVSKVVGRVKITLTQPIHVPVIARIS